MLNARAIAAQEEPMPPKGKTKPRKSSKPAYKADPDRRRLQVICTKDQESTLTDAAARAASKDRSAWILAVSLAAASSDGAITIPQPLAGQVTEHARALGQDPVELVRTWLAGSMAVHA
jgi:hypothetical protein